MVIKPGQNTLLNIAGILLVTNTNIVVVSHPTQDFHHRLGQKPVAITRYITDAGYRNLIDENTITNLKVSLLYPGRNTLRTDDTVSMVGTGLQLRTIPKRRRRLQFFAGIEDTSLNPLLTGPDLSEGFFLTIKNGFNASVSSFCYNTRRGMQAQSLIVRATTQ